jgi:hypothetical protein
VASGKDIATDIAQLFALLIPLRSYRPTDTNFSRGRCLTHMGAEGYFKMKSVHVKGGNLEFPLTPA